MTSTADRIAELDAMTAHSNDADFDAPSFNADAYIRDCLITAPDFTDPDDYHPLDPAIAATIRDHILAIDEHCALPFHSLDIELRSRLLLDYSLCPMHRCDYAICFDDDDPDCAAIRACFPNHDT